MSIGETLIRIRKERNCSQDNLAKRSGVTQGRISQIESGATQHPTSITLQKLATALNVSLDVFSDSQTGRLIESVERRDLDDDQLKALNLFKRLPHDAQSDDVEEAYKLYQRIKSLPAEDRIALEMLLKKFIS
ncbi:MAG: Helix-turn-helix domain [Firmicutes bacterium]|nr:Helix-turn-helix domain [Bacillota bacterium]